MSTDRPVPCRVRGYADTPAHATLNVRRLEPRERWRRSATHLAACWAAAAAAVFIPVAHLVLVPGLLAAGVFVAAGDLRTHHLVTGARGTCPDCGTEQQLEVNRRWRGRAEVACGHCHRLLRLEPVESPAP